MNPRLVLTQGIHAKRTSIQKVNDLIVVPPDIGLLYHYREVALCPTVSCRKYARRDHRLQNIAPQLLGGYEISTVSLNRNPVGVDFVIIPPTPVYLLLDIDSILIRL